MEVSAEPTEFNFWGRIATAASGLAMTVVLKMDVIAKAVKQPVAIRFPFLGLRIATSDFWEKSSSQ